MKIIQKIILAVLITVGIVLISSYSQAATVNIDAPSSANVGDTITVTVSINAAQWDLTINCNGRALKRDYELDNAEGNISHSFSATYTATQEGNITFSLTGDYTDNDMTNTVVNNKTKTVTVKPKVEPTPEPEPEPEPTPDPEPQTPPTPDTPSKPNYTVTEASGTFYITKSGVNLRIGPGTNYKSVGSAPANTEVQRTGTSGNWTRIKYNGQEVFISSQFLTATKPTEETDEPKEEDPQENTVVNQIQNEITNETTNEVTNEISSETSDENNIDDELQLKELKIEGVDTSSIFKPQVYEYNINVPKDVKKLEITATPNYKDATVEILGNKDFTEGENIVTIMIKSKDGEKTATYQLVVNVGAVAQSQSFPFNIVIYSIIAVIVIAIIVLIILIIRNRRNNEYNELDEDELSEEDNFNYYNNPMISNENEEEAPKSKRGKHF